MRERPRREPGARRAAVARRARAAATLAAAALAAALGAGAARVPAAHAGGLVVGPGSPRAIGRAGTGTVGDDGGGALLVNPAALARRDGARGQLGISFTDDEIAWHPSAAAPVARNQAPSALAPTGAAIGAIGPWIIGAGAMTAAVVDRQLFRPGDFAGALGDRFEFRYAGVTGSLRRDTLALGVARRLGDSVALGLALHASRVAVTEQRRVWAGFSGRDTPGTPGQDVDVAIGGRDPFVPGLVAGLLAAPEGFPLELGASIAWSHDLAIRTGDVRAAGTANGVAVRVASPSARIELRQPWTLRAGARYLAERVVAEVGGDLWIAPRGSAAAAWDIAGVSVVDRSSLETDLYRLPSRISLRTHGAVRASVDVELVGGFLWATAGYAYALGAVEGGRQSPTFGDLGGHTVALGLEATAGGFTLTAGWSRTWSVASRPAPDLRLDNPFVAGDRAVPTGEYDGSIDQLGLLVEAELDAPD